MAFGLISAQGHGICLADNSCPLLTAKTQQQNTTLPLWTIQVQDFFFYLFQCLWVFLPPTGPSYGVDQQTSRLMTASILIVSVGPCYLKRSGSWVNAIFPVTVEQLRALTLALWGLWEPSPRAFRQMLGGHWRVKEDRWMRDSNSTVVCAFRGSDLCGDWKDCRKTDMQIYNDLQYRHVWFCAI